MRRPGVPRVEVRLRVPTGTARPGDGTRERLLAASMLGGTSESDSVRLAERLQGLGAVLDASAGVEEVVFGGSVLANRLPEYLELLGEVVTDAQYPADEVEVHQGRIQQELTILRSQPTVLAQQALFARMYPKHPYGRGLPEPDSVDGITALALRRWHSQAGGAQRQRARARRRPQARRRPRQARRRPSGWAGARRRRACRPSRRSWPARASSSTARVRCRPTSASVGRPSTAPTRPTPACRWPTSSSAATSPAGSWPTSAKTRATPTARAAGSSTASAHRSSWSGPRWRPT